MSTATMVALTLLAALLHPFSASSSTVPAFLWSQHRNKNSDKGDIEFVDYRTISPRELAKAVVSQGGWSDMLCSVEKLQQGGDLAVVFVGRELQSSDISSNTHADPALLNLLRESYTKSNFSLAFPYVAASPKKGMENLLVSGFVESCGHDLDITKIALLGSCSMQEYLVSRGRRHLKGMQILSSFVMANLVLQMNSTHLVLKEKSSQNLSALWSSRRKSILSCMFQILLGRSSILR